MYEVPPDVSRRYFAVFDEPPFFYVFAGLVPELRRYTRFFGEAFGTSMPDRRADVALYIALSVNSLLDRRRQGAALHFDDAVERFCVERDFSC